MREESRRCRHFAIPALYQINTRVWLTELSRPLGRPATLDDIPDAELDRVAGMGFDWIWLLSVWRTGPAGQRVSRANPEWRREFEETLPDLSEEDIAGSGFAITGYTVHPGLGGDAALARLRERLRARGLLLMLDFVPNHTGLDHPWVEDHPEYYVPGTETDLARAPQNYTGSGATAATAILAYGRDPYFSGWPDTLQLDYGNPATQQAMVDELLKIAGQCDGVRCDMAMLVLPDVFERTWGRRPAPFWPLATAARPRAGSGLLLHGRGVLGPGMDDAATGIRLRLRQAALRPPARGTRAAGARAPSRRARLPGQARPLPGKPRRAAGRGELRARLARGGGRHHVSLAGPAILPSGPVRGAEEAHLAAPGARAAGAADQRAQQFYERLLAVLRQPTVRDGQWRLLECVPAWDGNWTWECFIAWSWEGRDSHRLIAVVNYAGNQSQCYVRLPFPDLAGRAVRLKDLTGPASYDREGSDLVSRGLYLDLPPWGYHVFEMTAW